jgi:hypothetical protein
VFRPALPRLTSIPAWVTTCSASAGRDGDAAPLVAEATAIFERLRATPWLERARAVSRAELPVEPVG